MIGMVNKSKIIWCNLLLPAAFLVYLCILDLLFVFIMHEQKSIINSMGLLVVTMPFIGALVTFKVTQTDESLMKRVMVSVVSFSVLAVVGFVQYLWVATSFHTMLGGTI